MVERKELRMRKIIIALLACFSMAQVWAADVTWLTSVPQAEEQAKKENKLVLIDFTGSDWCVWCQKLEKDTFSKQKFIDYAQANLVLVRLDYPMHKDLPDDLKKANDELAKKYDIEAYPTLIALKPDGTTVWKQEGYLKGGPKALIVQLDDAKKK